MADHDADRAGGTGGQKRTVEQQIDFIIEKQGSERAAIAYLIGALSSSEAIVESVQLALFRVFDLSHNTSAWIAGTEDDNVA